MLQNQPAHSNLIGLQCIIYVKLSIQYNTIQWVLSVCWLQNTVHWCITYKKRWNTNYYMYIKI